MTNTFSYAIFDLDETPDFLGEGLDEARLTRAVACGMGRVS